MESQQPDASDYSNQKRARQIRSSSQVIPASAEPIILLISHRPRAEDASDTLEIVTSVTIDELYTRSLRASKRDSSRPFNINHAKAAIVAA